MLFSSPGFLFVFLPLCVMLYYCSPCRWLQKSVLLVGSAAFYLQWSSRDGLVLTASLAINLALLYAVDRSARPRALWLTTLAVALNLGLLFYFKYAQAVIGWLADVGVISPYEVHVGGLPLAISFYTFIQIAFIVDVCKRRASPCSVFDYCQFVLFFPHLIAGPVVHHAQLLPALETAARRPQAGNIGAGLFFLTVGLFKKAIVADSLARPVAALFDEHRLMSTVGIVDVWSGVVGYAMQLYFDFSGYSDMAIGAAAMFGVTLPFNFDSPYKARSISDFWRRWHMTLSAFIREYVYIPLGGARCGAIRNLANLFITMVLAGVWHGAGAQFAVWGAFHGMALAVNRVFSRTIGNGLSSGRLGVVRSVSCWGLTLGTVLVGWVLFRAHSLARAGEILLRMVEVNGETIALPSQLGLNKKGLLVLMGVALVAPNSQQIYRQLCQVRPGAWGGRRLAYSALFGVVAFVALKKVCDSPDMVFLYFQF